MREREQHEQVEVPDGERPAEVGEPEEEERAEAEPDERVVDLPPEGAVVAARHLPGDLRPGPRLGHLVVVSSTFASTIWPGLAREPRP